MKLNHIIWRLGERWDGLFTTIWFWTVFYIDFVFPLLPKNLLSHLITSTSSAVHIRNRNCLPIASTWVHSYFFWVGSVFLIFLEFCVSMLYATTANSEKSKLINIEKLVCGDIIVCFKNKMKNKKYNTIGKKEILLKN